MIKISKLFILSSLLALFSLISVSFLWDSPLLVTLVLVIISIVIIGVGRSKVEDFYLYIITSFWGASGEAFAVYFGVWTYNPPDIIGIPVWLPLLWGIAGVFIKRIYLEIHHLIS